ncbi:MAG: hypothetical protein ABI277_17605 [Burkholderiaceae bacterium]
MPIIKIKAAVGCFVMASFATPVFADEPVNASAATVTIENPLGAKVLDTKALARQRGGTDPGTMSDMKLNGVVGNNNASNLTTGNNAITDGAFAGVNGVPLVVQNSGNNVLIQSATIINVQVK